MATTPTSRGESASNDDVTWNDFGAALQHIRARRGISQECAADLFHCSRNHIWRMEHGQTRPSRILLGSMQHWLRNLQGREAATAQEEQLLAAFVALRTKAASTGA